MTYAINKRADQDQAFLAHEVGKLVDQTVKAKSIAAQISTKFATERPAVDFPLFTTPVTTGFIDELADLPLSNADTDSVTAIAYKIAGATQASSEMLADMSPDIAAQIGASISDNIIWSLDTAVLGNATSHGPSGLRSLSSTLVAGELTDTDVFVKAVYAARNAAVSADVSHFVVSPATAESLSLLKTSSGSNQNLLQFQEDGTILVAGVPLLVSSLVDASTIGWAVDQAHSRLVLRAGTQVIKTYVPQNDSWFISGVARYGWVNLAPASVIRIVHAPVTYTVTVDATGGTFTLSLNGKESAAIAENASAAALKSAIVAIDDGVEDADVTVTGSAGGPYTVTVPGVLTGSGASLTGGTGLTIVVA